MAKHKKTAPKQKVQPGKSYTEEKPISSAYPANSSDPARDDLENDIPDADLWDI